MIREKIDELVGGAFFLLGSAPLDDESAMGLSWGRPPEMMINHQTVGHIWAPRFETPIL
jgi:hypothetical protein